MASFSGGRSGKVAVEDCLTLDLAWLMRLGPVRTGQAGSGQISWAADGRPIGSARFRLDLRDANAARLIVRYRSGESDHREPETEQLFALASTPQNFGGRRWWLRCPVTGDRARAVYLAPGGERFASRKALGLAYRMEGLDRLGRAFEQLERTHKRYSGPRGTEFGKGKPKGMWRRTFMRRAERLAALDADCASRVGALFQSDQAGTL